MLKSLIYLGCAFVAAAGILVVDFPDGLVGVLVVAVLAAAVILILRKSADDREFLTLVFLGALVLRMLVGVFIHVFELGGFFGVDALNYDVAARGLWEVWTGRADLSNVLEYRTQGNTASFWGIYYLITSIYYVFGPKMFVAQSIFAVVGAATAPMVYFCSKKIFNNQRVARFAAVSIAVFPSLVVWSSQLLKDGLIIFLLVTIIVAVLKLQEKFSYFVLAVLIFSMFGIFSLRFYIFYMIAVAVAGSFLVGLSDSRVSIFRNTVILVLVAVAFLYFGMEQQVTYQLETYANLERIQMSRLDLAKSAESGFGAEADVSTAEGALLTIPIGFTYLMFAPFPWEAVNLRQAITIPDTLLWWATFPFLVIGLVYTIRNRLRSAFPILIFSLLLTLAYSIGQGNVGTAYRQRTQIQVFLFILIGVGYTVFKERRENERIIKQAARRRVDERLRAGRLVTQK